MESLQLLKQDLEITNTLRDEWLVNLLDTARDEVILWGITPKQEGEDGYVLDQNIIVSYAAWLYRKRAGDQPTMPRMLQWRLHQRLFAEKGAV